MKYSTEDMNDSLTSSPMPSSPMAAPTPDRSAANPSISCVVPAHNEAQNLPRLLPQLIERLRSLTPRWEIVLVDDGSRDRTLAAIAPWLGSPGVTCLALSRNFGKEAALGAGLDHARGDVVVTMDADLQHPVEMIDEMLTRWRAGVDMVYAVRADRQDEPAFKRVGARLFYSLLRVSSAIDIPPHAGDFRLMDRCVVDAICALPERTRFMKGLYAWVGYRSEAIEFSAPPRTAGRSHFGAKTLFSLAASGITAFSNLPLRVASGVGSVLALLTFAYGVYVVAEHFFGGHNVPGWATIVAGMMFFSGVQLLFIGILGEYLGRVYEEVKQRPRYIVARTIGTSAIETQRTIP